MSQLTRSVIDLAPSVRESLENELTTPDVNNIPKELPVEKKVEPIPVDSEEVKKDLEIMNQNIKEESGEPKPQEENAPKTFSNNVPAEIVPRVTAYDYKDVVNKLQNYDSLSPEERVDITRAINTKKRLEKPSAFNIFAPIKFKQDFVDFNTFDAGQNYSFAFDASSINFNSDIELYEAANFLVTGYDISKRDKYGVARNIAPRRYRETVDGISSLVPSDAIRDGGLLSTKGLTSLEKSFLLNTARPSVALYAVPAGVYDTALTPVELGITDSQLKENDISLDTEFLAFSIDGLRQQRIDATVRGYVDAFGNPVIERNSEGEIEKYVRFSRDIKFAQTVNASERLPIAKKQEIIAMYNDNIRAGISSGMTLNELGMDILNAALAAGEFFAETGTAVGLGTAVDPNLIKARTEALKRIEEDKKLGNYVFGQGIQMITASEADPKTGMVEKFRFESIMDKTADELGVDPTVLKELVGRNFSYVEDMVDYSLDPVTYFFGAAGVGLINFARYFGGTKLVKPYLLKKYNAKSFDDLVEKVYKGKNGARQLESDIAEAAEAYAAETVAKGPVRRILSHPSTLNPFDGRTVEDKIADKVAERAAQALARNPAVSGIVIQDQIGTLTVRKTTLSEALEETTDNVLKGQIQDKLNMINNRITLLERFPNMVKFDLAYGRDIKDEAFLLAGSAAANRWFMNSNYAAGPGEEPDFKMIAGASFLGGMGGLIAANQLGRVAASKFVKTVDNIGLALVSGGASLKSINAILDTEIKDPKLRARVKKDILKLSKREFIKIQDAARQFNETVDSIMEINKFIPEGGEKLNREDVKVSVFHLFGVGLEASVDYAMTTIDTSKVKDVKNILKLRQEVLKRDEERSLVVGKVINQIFPYKENLSEDASSTLDILAQMNEIKRVTSENDLESLKYAIAEIRNFTARSSGLASPSADVEANVTLREALQDGIDRGEINPAILDDEEIDDVINILQREVDEIIAINKENHEFIKDSIDNVVNTLEGKTLGALMVNDLDSFKANASKKYNDTRDSFIEENIGVTVKVDDFRDLTNANAQYRTLDFAEEVNFRSRAESDADILDEPEDLMSDTTSRATNPDAYNSDEYIKNEIKDSKDKGTLREIQKFSLGPAGVERLNAIFEPAAKRALIELYEYIGEENSHLFLTQTHRLFLSLPENLKKRFPIKSGRFIEVYDFHRNFSKALADGKITRDQLGENANTLLNNYSTLELMNKDPARYAEGLALELNFKEIIVLRQALVKKKNKLFTQKDRSRERETVEQIIRDLDTVIKTNGIDKTKGEAVDGEAIIEQFENLSSIWQDRSIRYSRNHKGEGFYENKSSKILEALEKNQFERVQQLVVETFGGSTNLNNILLETKEGQHLVKIYGGVQGPGNLYYPTEETAKSLRFILRAAYANAYKETKAGVALYRALEDNNITNIPGVYNQRGFEILKERMGADPETGTPRTYPLLKTSDQIEAFHQNVQNIPIYSVGDDGRVLINKDTGEPIAVTTLDANSDIVPLADINVLARLQKNVKEIKKQERQLRKIASAYRISHNLTASKLSNIARGFDPTAGNLNYDDIMGTALTDTGFVRWSQARALLSKADQEKWDTLSSDLLSLHIGKRIRGGLAGDDVLDFREVENILNDQQMVDYINKIDSNIIPSLTKLKELGEFLYPPTHALRAGTKPIPFRPESMFSKVYGLKNNKVSPTFVTAEFLFRANKQRKYNAQTYLVTHPEFANALYEYATKKTVMSIDVGKDHMAKVVSYFGRQVAMQSFYTREYGDYMPKVTITGPKSKFGDRLETPENPKELLNQLKKIKQMQQKSLQTQGATQ